MPGRGRNATLPAWMTKGDAAPVAKAPTRIDVAMPEPTAGKKTSRFGGISARGRGVSGTNRSMNSMKRGVNVPNRSTNGGSVGRGKMATAPAWRNKINNNTPVGAKETSSSERSNATSPRFSGQRSVPSVSRTAQSNLRSSSRSTSFVSAQTGNTAAPSVSKSASGWTTHRSPQGKTYYYHAATKRSVWEKPDALKTPAERAPSSVWKAFPAPNGRTYYYNSQTKQSVWQEPEELKKIREAKMASASSNAMSATGMGLNATNRSQNGGALSSRTSNYPAPVNRMQQSNMPVPSSVAKPVVAPVHKKEPKPKKPRILPVYASKEEAIAAFESLLRAKNIGSGVHYNALKKKISYDVRWDAIRNNGERRQYYAEYRGRKFKEEREEGFKLRQTLKADFEQVPQHEYNDVISRFITVEND